MVYGVVIAVNDILKYVYIALRSFYAPNFEKVGDILVSACPYVCMYVFMFEISSCNIMYGFLMEK